MESVISPSPLVTSSLCRMEGNNDHNDSFPSGTEKSRTKMVYSTCNTNRLINSRDRLEKAELIDFA